MNKANLTVVVALLLATGCHAAVRGNGVIRSEPREAPAFEGVEVCCGIDATVTLGPKSSIVLEGDENLLKLVKTEVKDQRLIVEVQSGLGLKTTRPIKLTVVTPRLTSIEASGGSSVVAQASEAPKLAASASGGGEVTLRGIKTDQLTVTGSGGGQLSLSGSTRVLAIDLSGGTTLEAGELVAEVVEVDGSGGAEGTVHASAEVMGTLSGGASLRVHGNPPKSRVQTSGGAEVRYTK